MNNLLKRKFADGQIVADMSLLFVAIVWGSSYLATKIILIDYEVFPFLFIRFAFTVIILLFFTWKSLKNATMGTWITGIILGLFLAGIFTSETWGINFTTSSNAGFLISLTIIFTPLVESIVSRSRLRLGILFAVLLSVVGTGLLTLKQGYQFNIGDLLIIVAALLRAIQMTFTQKLTFGKEMDSGALTTIQLSIVAIIMAFVSVFVNGLESITLDKSLLFWSLTFYLAVFGTLLAFYIQLVMIRKTSPTRVGLLMGTEPIFATLFAILLGGENLSIQGWIGGFLIVIATYYGRYVELKYRTKVVNSEV